MKPILSLSFCFLLPLLAFATAVRDTQSSYSESYTILIKGNVAGTETVSEKAEGSDIVTTSEHEMLVSDGLETARMAFSTRMVMAKNTGIPSSYSCWYTSGSSGDSYDVTIKDGQITRILNRRGNVNEVTIPSHPGMVFVDFNVYHQFEYLIRKYDSKKGGRQTFPDFIPIIGNDVPVALTYLGESKIERKSGPLPIRNFRVEFVGIWGGNMSVDKDGRLVKLLIPKQEIEVLRQDLIPEQ